MSAGMLVSGMPTEFGDALIVIDAIALVVFFGMLYPNQIAAATARFLKLLSPSLLLARLRLWRSEHNLPH